MVRLKVDSFGVRFPNAMVLDCTSRFQCQPIQPDTIGGQRSLLLQSMMERSAALCAYGQVEKREEVDNL